MGGTTYLEGHSAGNVPVCEVVREAETGFPRSSEESGVLKFIGFLHNIPALSESWSIQLPQPSTKSAIEGTRRA